MLNTDLLRTLRKTHKEATDLLAQADPPERPFDSKYAGRSRLQQMVSTVLDEAAAPEDHRNALLGALFAQIGCIDIEVEEFSTGEKNLTKALEKLGQVETVAYRVLPEQKALNQMGILWCLRSDYAKAYVFLEKALSTYLDFKKNSGDAENLYDLSDLLDPNEFCGSSEKEKSLELLNTYTYYYLAQVYEKMGNPHKSAECCNITLSKQLEMKEYKSVDWATNAATLSQYFISGDHFRPAKIHLAAASFVLAKHRSELDSTEMDEEDKEEAEEKYRRCEADVARCWGKYCYFLMKISELKKREADGEDIEIEDLEQSNIPEISEFSSVEFDDKLMSIPDEKAKTFEEAREIFLPGQRFFNAAKQFFTMDDCCTDYTEINQDLSKMYKVLVFFEPDPDRRFKMHKRRVDLLEEVLNELSPTVYTLICRQLHFELAETYSAMMDIKMDKFAKMSPEETIPQQIAKINALVQLSSTHFNKFLDTFLDINGKMPESFSDENARPILVAYFHLARLYEKFLVPKSSQQKLKNTVGSFCNYKEIVDYCSRNPSAAAVVPAELPLCQEMVQLLPLKIEKMRREYGHNLN